MAKQAKSGPPARIYLQWHGDAPKEHDYLDVAPSEVSWCAERVFPRDVVYVRLVRRKRKRGQGFIAAAPDLYEACKTILEEVHYADCPRGVEAIQKAMKKAGTP